MILFIYSMKLNLSSQWTFKNMYCGFGDTIMTREVPYSSHAQDKNA